MKCVSIIKQDCYSLGNWLCVCQTVQSDYQSELLASSLGRFYSRLTTVQSKGYFSIFSTLVTNFTIFQLKHIFFVCSEIFSLGLSIYSIIIDLHIYIIIIFWCLRFHI